MDSVLIRGGVNKGILQNEGGCLLIRVLFIKKGWILINKGIFDE